MNNHINSIPWVEKYRPTSFDDIVLDPWNKKMMETIISKKYFPNLLLYGPPGTGKTTTIINLVNSFQNNKNNSNKGMMIHLNASDERGIDIIRNQISQFVNSNSLFNQGIKFVILDEVDYMTKNAQHALKYLLQYYNNNVRFCLICNYISRIDESLQNEFTRLRFNQLPQTDIIRFLRIISEKENLNIAEDKLKAVQNLFRSDIRSMINYLQSNQTMIQPVIDNIIWDTLTETIKHMEGPAKPIQYLDHISLEYNIETKNLLKDYLNYINRYNSSMITGPFLRFVEFIMHLQEPNVNHLKHYFVITLHELLQ
jgi:replication factor C subunit 3/5